MIRRFGSFFLCAFVFCLFSPIYGQEGVIQRVAAPITAPIQSVQSALSHSLSSPPKVSSFRQVNSALPGLGTLPRGYFNDSATSPPVLTPSVLPPVFAGSIELLPTDSTGAILPTALASRQMETTGNTILSLPLEEETEPIILSAQMGWRKEIGKHTVYFLRGCSFRKGRTTAQSPEAVVWIAAERDEITNIRKVTLYLESDSAQMPVQIEQTDSQEKVTRITDLRWLGHWHTLSVVDVRIVHPLPPQEEPAIYWRALALMNPDKTPPAAVGKEEDKAGVVQTQFLSSTAIPQLEGLDLGFRRVQLTPRSDNQFNVAIQPYHQHDPALGGIAVLTGGINLIVEGVSDTYGILSGSTVDISADNAVIWTDNPGKIHGSESYTESAAQDFEVYLEGNIVYRDGPRVVHASRMYYDAKYKIAYILDGHLFAPISELGGMKGVTKGAHIHLKADILRQMGEGLFTARNAMITTSQLGEPTYSLRSQTLRLDRQVSYPFGNSEAGYRQVLVAESNYIALRKVPVFYWPWMATDMEDPTFYIKNFSYGNSSNNGHTVKTRWNPFQILNIRRPDGIDSEVDLTWMEKRGIGHGATFQYDLPSLGPLAGPLNGKVVYWGIYDHGTDRLGGSRREVTFPDPYRYRFYWVHQQQANQSLHAIGGHWDVRASVGKVSDRNLLNSYFNSAWHTEENAVTAVDLTCREENRTLTFSAEYALDKHYTNANWLPRLDSYVLGESLFNDYLTWYQHSRVGLLDYHTADAPFDSMDQTYFRYLPWEVNGNNNQPGNASLVNATGLVFATRHELDLPIQAGALKVVPYVLGDFSVWGHNQTGSAADRLYGQGGVRLNLPIWKINPKISSRTWYVNGLAHKIDMNAEYMYAQANRSMDDLILTDPLDHWSVEDFRRRYLVTNSFFGGTMPGRFDPRYYALRSGLAGNVTAGNMEIADDMQMFRLGTTHRFQTKRGPVGNRRILDWITFSTHINYYPQSQYNYGKNIGLLDYNILWHVGDRFSVFSEGLYDFFDDGQGWTRIGGIWNRPDRGNFSVTFDQLSGIMERSYLTWRVGYMMNEKYSMSYSTSYDIQNHWRNTGHNFMFVRTGESFRLLVGASYSESLDEWSFSLGIEPTFLQLKRLLSADGLEN